MLPGRDWREQIVKIDPTLATVLRHQEQEWTIGYAAIPDTLGKKLEDLPSETILFVQYQGTEPLDVLQDVEAIGSPHSTERAFAITVQGVDDGWVRPQSLARIGLLLGRQGVPGLK